MLYRRPESVSEAKMYLSSSLSSMEGKKDLPIYSSLWKGMHHMLEGSGFVDNVLCPYCEKSEISLFLVKTLSPILEEMICTPDRFSKKVETALCDPSLSSHAKKFYEAIEKLKKGVEKGLSRREEMDESFFRSVETVHSLLENDFVCESLRLFYMIDGKARLAMDVTFPRLCDSFRKDKSIVSEKANFLFFSQFS
jgi:hypothetical protein